MFRLLSCPSLQRAARAKILPPPAAPFVAGGVCCRSPPGITPLTWDGNVHQTTEWSRARSVASCSAIKHAPHRNNKLSKIATPIKDITKVYDIGEVLGEGGFGKVYRATRRSDGMAVALKRIPKEWTKSDEFQREVNALCRLNDVAGGHTHICQVYDVFEDDGQYWMSMELIEGGEVFEHLIEKGAYSEAMAATFLRQFAEALAFMHSAGVVQ